MYQKVSKSKKENNFVLYIYKLANFLKPSRTNIYKIKYLFHKTNEKAFFFKLTYSSCEPKSPNKS